MLGSNVMGSGRFGIAFLVSGGAVAEFVAKACSSPQTVELNAEGRAPTLMKWVNVGMVEAILMVGIAAYVDKKDRVPIIAGALTEIVITYGEYWYAKEYGMRKVAAGIDETTES